MNKRDRTFVGFGFGAIQAGLFLYEAARSGNFAQLVVAEVVPEIVDAVRRAGSTYHLNIAGPHGIVHEEVPGVEILNPSNPADLAKLLDRIADASEIATGLPSVEFYAAANSVPVAGILARGLELRALRHPGEPAIIYAAENHNHAADLLLKAIGQYLTTKDPLPFQCLDTVIGKMSGIVSDPDQICEQGLKEAAPGLGRCFLVEEFNRILISAVALPDFERGIGAFEEKPDLLPFEEAKLYGHNATHALLGYVGRTKGLKYIADAAKQPNLLGLARNAFINESGAALCQRHKGLDNLFTENGYAAYAEDLLERMVNPHLRDTIERIVRDPARKLGWDDRLAGTMRVCMAHGIAPSGYALGAAAAARMLARERNSDVKSVLLDLWKDADATDPEKEAVRTLVMKADQSGPMGQPKGSSAQGVSPRNSE